MNRVWIPLAGVLLIYLAVMIRLAHLQIFLHRPLADKTVVEVTGKERVRPWRGRILDRSGRVLAVSVELPSLFVNLRETRVSRRVLAKTLANAVAGVSAHELERRLERSKNFVWIKRLATAQELERVRRLDLAGVGWVFEPERRNPLSEAGALLGEVNLDGGGAGGLEAKLNPLLQGREEVLLVLRDALGKVFSEQAISAPEPAGGNGRESGPFDVWVTMDGELQSRVQDHLSRTVVEQGALAGVALVMDVKSGALLAVAGKTQGTAKELWGGALDPNLGVSYTYEPGSVIKPFVVAAALAEGKVKESDEFDCEGGTFHLMPGFKIQDHEPYNILKLGQVLAYSSNIGMVKMAQMTGPQPLYDTLRSFGFGSKTGIPLTGEAAGIVRSPEVWSGMSLAMHAFGYEIGVTPLQLTAAFAALGNDGILLEPQIVGRVTPWRSSRPLYEISPRRVRRAVSSSVARRTVKLMQEVMDYGTGKAGQMAGYPSAGKTGTAQKIDPKTKKHTPSHVVVTFCGLLSVPNPDLAICVLLDDARRPRVAWASDLAVPLFKKISQEAVVILGIPPSDLAKRS